MGESDVRSVLLVKAIEESDREGAIVTPAERAAASREAKRGVELESERLRFSGGALPPAAERLLVRRAEVMLDAIRRRHPFVDEVAAFSPGRWLTAAMLAAALAFGFALSALDGTRRINVLAFPLWGLVAWNLAVYAFVAIAWMRRDSPARAVPAWAADAAMRRISALAVRARRFHTPLAEALSRFAGEWQQAARKLLVARAARMFHVAAAVLGVGLIAGFYLRGVALDYQAGWESTFLDAAGARRVLAALYAPASASTGIAVPDEGHLAAIRWRDGAGGEAAAPWIHLLAATALVFVVLPRMLLAIAATVGIAHAARRMALPSAMHAYFNAAFAEVGVAVSAGDVRVVPYAYEPDERAIERLRRELAASHPHAAVDIAPAIAYGREDDFDAAGSVALLFTLAATPEDENHGRVIEAARRAASRLDVFVDEAPYADRMQGGLEARIEERRRAWRTFVAAHGVEPRFLGAAR